MDKCFTCKTTPLCRDHAAGLCPACQILQPSTKAQQAEGGTLPPDQQIRRDCGITCYIPVDTTVLYLLLHSLPDQPPSPFRPDEPLPTAKVVECPVREWVHEAEHLPSPNDAKLALLASQPGTIVAVRERFGGIAVVFGGGQQDVVWQWDMSPVDTPILDPNTALSCGCLAESLREGVYVCRY